MTNVRKWLLEMEGWCFRCHRIWALSFCTDAHLKWYGLSITQSGLIVSAGESCLYLVERREDGDGAHCLSFLFESLLVWEGEWWFLRLTNWSCCPVHYPFVCSACLWNAYVGKHLRFSLLLRTSACYVLVCVCVCVCVEVWWVPVGSVLQQ